MSQIKKLHRIYNFIKDSDCVDKKIKVSNGYSNWITLAQSDDLKSLVNISMKSNDAISKFLTNSTAISFDDVFENFELDIKYELRYIKTKPNNDDIYYPHHLPIVENKTKFIKRTINCYSKPNLSTEENKGVYFIYDLNGEIVYIGKSNSNLLSRSCTSARERTRGRFLKIELRPMKTHADVNIYEMYYISKFQPIHNIDSCPDDLPTIELPEVPPKHVIEKIKSDKFEVEKIYPNLKYIKSESYWENPEKYYLDAEFTRSGFMKKFTENRSETILSDEFNDRLNELTSEGYIVFTTSEN